MLVKEIAEFLGGILAGNGNIEVRRIAGLDAAMEGDISFVEKEFIPNNASCLLVSGSFDEDASCPLIRVKNPKLAFAKIAKILHPQKDRGAFIHPSAIVSDSARLGKDIFVGAFCCIGDGSEIGDGSRFRAGAKIGDRVKIGKKCVIHPNVFIEDDSIIGDEVILHSGVVIGADGFGYVRAEDGYIQFPQIGNVVIEDKVEIGANTCVDRGALGETRIGEGTKIDNLVQVAHNVRIGKRVVIAAQTGISGSTIIEDDVVIGGQVGIGDHARILSGAVIGSQAGVLPNKIVRPGVWWGTPIQPLDEYKRQNAMVKGLGRLREEIKEIKKSCEK